MLFCLRLHDCIKCFEKYNTPDVEELKVILSCGRLVSKTVVTSASIVKNDFLGRVMLKVKLNVTRLEYVINGRGKSKGQPVKSFVLASSIAGLQTFILIKKNSAL